MNNRWLLGWLQAPQWQRVLSFIALSVLLLLLLWQLWLHPVQRQLQQLKQQRQQQTERYQARQQLLLTLPALAALEQQVQQLTQRLNNDPIKPFSLAGLLTASKSTLVHWQPLSTGGEVALDLQWEQFADLLSYLSTLRPVVSIVHFTLQREGAQLRLLLELSYEK